MPLLCNCVHKSNQTECIGFYVLDDNLNSEKCDHETSHGDCTFFTCIESTEEDSNNEG